jgi:hypothetical protein
MGLGERVSPYAPPVVDGVMRDLVVVHRRVATGVVCPAGW